VVAIDRHLTARSGARYSAAPAAALIDRQATSTSPIVVRQLLKAARAPGVPSQVVGVR
jgi:hypothetical protein